MMAIQDRIFSLETEYAISFYADDGTSPGAGAIVSALSQALSERYGLSHTSYLVNGSLLAHDVGHAEWSLPECRSAREVAAYDKAADHLFHLIVPRAQQLFEAQGMSGRIVVTKNNADNFGHTYGCHENYQMLRDADLLTQDNFVRYMAHVMIPFLVSRQLLVGSGRLITRRGRGGAELSYELSQRAGFIQTVVARDTTRDRPIFNLGREGESFSVGNFRRLHPILGDANLSGWATWIKLGSMGFMLRMVEDLFIENPPALVDPVGALKAISQDITGQVRVKLQDGREVTGLDVQWEYYDHVDAYLTLMGASDEDEALMEEWGRALEDCGQDTMRLRDRADWAIKKQMLDTFLQSQGCSFAAPPADQHVLTDLQALDLRYHEVSPDGLYAQLYPVDTLVTEDEIRRAQNSPPPYTRACIRGTAIRLGRELGLSVRTGGWMDVGIEGENLDIGDPMEFDHPALIKWTSAPWKALDTIETGGDESDNGDSAPLHYRRGMCYRQYGRHQQALPEFRAALREADSRKYLRALAEQLVLVGRYGEALDVFARYNARVREAHDEDESFQAFIVEHVGPGDAHRLLGQDDQARAFYREALQTKAISALVAYRNLGLLDLKRGDLTQAARAFQEALHRTGERLVSAVALGAIRLHEGQADEARGLFEQALALAEQRAAGYGQPVLTVPASRYFEAVARLALGQAGALDALREALRQCSPDAAEGLYALEPLLRLLSEAPQPPPEARAALDLAAGESIPHADGSDTDSGGTAGRDTDASDTDTTGISAGDADASDADNSASGSTGAAELPEADPNVIRWLSEALSCTNPRVRGKAVEYLGWRINAEQQGVIEALFPVLLARARHDSDTNVRRAAILNLGHPFLARPGLMNELMRWLHDPDPVIRWAAQDSLDRISRSASSVSRAAELVAAVTGGDAHSREDEHGLG